MYHDDGDRFWIEGANSILVRGDLSREQWETIPGTTKALLLRFGIHVASQSLMAIPACAYCGELILPREQRAPVIGLPMHFECGFRMVGGSVGHQMGLCECHGFTDTSEDGLSLREAARASLAYFQRVNKRSGPA
jgi:hypothetical protein